MHTLSIVEVPPVNSWKAWSVHVSINLSLLFVNLLNALSMLLEPRTYIHFIYNLLIMPMIDDILMASHYSPGPQGEVLLCGLCCMLITICDLSPTPSTIFVWGY